jgi:hypothetical protein
MKTSLAGLASRLRAMILALIFFVSILLTIWMFVMLTANLSSIYEDVGKRNQSNWSIPILPQMSIVIY